MANPSLLDARVHAEEASRLIRRGDEIVENGRGPGGTIREEARNYLYERAQVHALAALALKLTEVSE